VARGQLAAGDNISDGWSTALRRNTKWKQEEEDEDLFLRLRKFKEFTVK
jgi:hypothetical protein